MCAAQKYRDNATAAALDRRGFLALAAAGAASLALDPRSLLAVPAGPLAIAKKSRRLLQLNAYATDAETPLDALTTYLTPNDLFFVRHHWNPQPVEAKKWRLVVDGEVETPLSLSLAELKNMEQTDATCVLQCAGNGRGLYRPTVPGVQWKYGAVGNARWTGVRVKTLLERAGLKAGAKHLQLFGSDTPPGKVPPFNRSLEIEKALEDAIIALTMNGEPLPALHGAPARLVVPGWAGDHWMKWLARISPQAEAQKGFYMETAYKYPKTPGAPGTPVKPDEMQRVTELFVKSNFTTVPGRARVGESVTLRGFAFSGAPDIAKVEISDDDGVNWREAELGGEHDPHAWRLWSFAWTPAQSGPARLLTRATDSRGSVQPREAAWNPSGYLHNGWHAAAIEVTP